MADEKISGLTAVVTPLGTDLFAVVQQAEINVRTRKGQAAQYVTFQNAYTNASSTITLTSSRGSFLIQDAATPIATTLFGVGSNGTGVDYIDITAGITYFGNNLSFQKTGSPGNRLIGYLSATTPDAERLLVQTQTTNGSTYWGAIPNGSSKFSDINLYGASSVTNCSILTIEMEDDTNGPKINSTNIGSGTTRSLSIQMEGTTYWTFDAGGDLTSSNASFQATNITATGTLLGVDLINTGLRRVPRIPLSSTTNTGAAGDAEVYAYTSTSSAYTLTLSSAQIALSGWKITIKDESGGAATNNITIDTEGAQTIDGLSSIAITANYGSVTLYSNGSNVFSI